VGKSVRQHWFHIKVDMVRMYLTGTGGVGSALLSVDNDLAHDIPPRIGCEENDSLPSFPVYQTIAEQVTSPALVLGPACLATPSPNCQAYSVDESKQRYFH
jgi:hypothetical protein